MVDSAGNNIDKNNKIVNIRWKEEIPSLEINV